MTVLAHSYLLAKKAILEIARDNTFYQYAESIGAQDKFILTDKKTGMPQLPENASEATKKAYAKLAKIGQHQENTNEQLRKLYRAEYKLMSYATLGLNTGTNGHEKKWAKNNPFAFEAAVLATPFIIGMSFPYAIYYLGKECHQSLEYYLAVKKTEKETKQEQKALRTRLEKEKQIAEEGANLESKDLQTVLEIISKSNGIKSRYIENKPDKNAIIMGLVLPEKTAFRNRKIKLSDNIYAFYYSKSVEIPYNNHEESAENRHALLTVFYKNPKTGNYHQIAQLIARKSIEAVFEAIKLRQQQLELIAEHKQAINNIFIKNK